MTLEYFVNEDNLSILTDDQLRKLFLRTRSSLYSARRNRKSTRNIEIDMCYIQREMQLRKQFRK